MCNLLTENELCKFLKVDRVFLWRNRKLGLPFKRLGTKIIRYDLEEVLKWINSNSVLNSKEE